MGLVISKKMYSMHFDEYVQHQGGCCTRLRVASLKLLARAEISTNFSCFHFSQTLESTLFSEGAPEICQFWIGQISDWRHSNAMTHSFIWGLIYKGLLGGTAFLSVSKIWGSNITISRVI